MLSWYSTVFFDEETFLRMIFHDVNEFFVVCGFIGVRSLFHSSRLLVWTFPFIFLFFIIRLNQLISFRPFGLQFFHSVNYWLFLNDFKSVESITIDIQLTCLQSKGLVLESPYLINAILPNEFVQLQVRHAIYFYYSACDIINCFGHLRYGWSQLIGKNVKMVAHAHSGLCFR